MNTAAATKVRRSNTYAGKCVCGAWVKAGAGVLGGKVNGRWTVECGHCVAIPSRSRSATPLAVRTATRKARHCITDGNCSSFGNGKSCGAEACDGW